MRLDLVPTPTGAYQHLHGGPLVFCAPHEEAQVRDGSVKIAEHGTGPLAMRAAQLCDGSALVTHGPQLGDPAWDDQHPLAVAALDLARDGALVDLHQMRPRGFDICLGLGPDHLLARRIWLPVLDELLACDLTVCLNWPFAARGKPLVARAARAGIPAVQVEISYALFEEPDRIEHVALAVSRAAVTCGRSLQD